MSEGKSNPVQIVRAKNERYAERPRLRTAYQLEAGTAETTGARWKRRWVAELAAKEESVAVVKALEKTVLLRRGREEQTVSSKESTRRETAPQRRDSCGHIFPT